MAHPLVRAGALDLLEEAVHTLRAAPLATIQPAPKPVEEREEVGSFGD